METLNRSSKIRRTSDPEPVHMFANVALNMSTALAAQHERLNAIEQGQYTLREDIKESQQTQTDEHRITNQRIDTVQSELKTRIDTVHLELNKKIDDVNKSLTSKMDDESKSIKDHIDSGLKDMKGRLGSVEKWRYIIVGGSIVVVFILTEVLLRVFGDSLLKFF